MSGENSVCDHASSNKAIGWSPLSCKQGLSVSCEQHDRSFRGSVGAWWSESLGWSSRAISHCDQCLFSTVPLQPPLCCSQWEQALPERAQQW